MAVKRRIGYLPENPYFYDYLTAEELLQYFAGLFGYAAAERRRRVAALLDEVGIGAERRLQLRKFSKGMLQRVGIAQAIINDPEIVFFDEPMSGLDPMGRREIRELILRLRDRGCTVFFSSHVLSDAEALCSRVAILASWQTGGGRVSCPRYWRSRRVGWELVVGGLDDAVLETARASGLRSDRATSLPLGSQRYALGVCRCQSRTDRVVAESCVPGRTNSSRSIRSEKRLKTFYMRQIGAVPARSGPGTAV